MFSLNNNTAKEPPKDYCCPITNEIMVDPVMAADGHSYERSAITTWLTKNNTSPLTREELEHKQVISNRTLKKAIQSFVEENKVIYQQQFIRAMEENDYNTVLNLEKLGIDIKSPDRNGWTILHYAAFEGNEEKALHWLEKGINKDTNSAIIRDLPLARVATHGLLEEIQSLNKKITELERQESHFNSIVEKEKKYYENWSRNYNTYSQELKKYYENCTNLRKAQTELSDFKEKLRVKKYELSTEEKISFSQLTPLHLAICQGHTNIILLLLNKGANIEAKANDVSPLFFAIYHNNIELIKLLVSYGASVDTLDAEGGTVFHAAARFADKPIVDYFLMLGVNAQIKNNGGQTHAEVATYYRRHEIAKYLAEKAKEQDVSVPRRLAEQNKRIEMLEQQVKSLQEQLVTLLNNQQSSTLNNSSSSQSLAVISAKLGVFSNQPANSSNEALDDSSSIAHVAKPQ